VACYVLTPPELVVVERGYMLYLNITSALFTVFIALD